METIYNGSRSDDFVMMLVKVLKKGKLKREYLNKLLSPESLKQYHMAFTAKSADPTNNYERFEQIGDVTVNKFIVWYCYRRFPQLDCTEGVKVVARLRINYGSKESLAKLGESLGFWSYISAREEGTERNMYYRNRNKLDLLEDCFEAFVGCTEYLLDKYFRPGVGYAIVYDILEDVFKGVDMTLEYDKLYDAKTRLKETFDMFKTQIGTWKFEETKVVNAEGFTTTHSQLYQLLPGSHRILIGEGNACKRISAQQIAAERGIQFLKERGIFKQPPPEYRKFQSYN